MRFMNEEQKLKQKATEMLNYFKTTYEKDLTAVRKGPPEVMQRRQNRKLYTRMWGGSRTNMLHSSNRQGDFEGVTTASMVGEAFKRHVKEASKADRLVLDKPPTTSIVGIHS